MAATNMLYMAHGGNGVAAPATAPHAPRGLICYQDTLLPASGDTVSFVHNLHLHVAGVAPSNTFVGGFPTRQYICWLEPRTRTIVAASGLPVVLCKLPARVVIGTTVVGGGLGLIFRPYRVWVRAIKSPDM